MAIGNFGKNIKFSVSSKQVLTFQNFKLSASGRWAEIERIGAIPYQQYLGPANRSITMEVTLSAAHGVKPRAMQSKFWEACYKGKPEYLVIGNKKVTSHKFVITDISEAWDVIYNKGEVARMKLNVTFKGYV